MPKVSFVKEKQEIEVAEGANLRDEALKAGIQVNFMLGNALIGRYLNCRGHGTCASCHVLVKDGMENLSPKSGWENFRLRMALATIGCEEESRLACRSRVMGDCSVETNPSFNWNGDNFWQKPYPNK